MRREDIILQILRIIFPGHKTWLIKTLVIAGVGIIARPFWEPFVVALLSEYVTLDIPNADWVGWALLFIGLAIYALNEWVAKFEEKPNSKDIQLFEEFSAIFAENDRIRFYKEHDFLGSFNRKDVKPLYTFVEHWDNADHEFVDEELERERKNVYEKGKALGVMIASRTVPIRDGEFISVKPDHLPYGPTPDWVHRDAKEISNLVPPFVEAHEAFIRLGKKKLFSR